MDQTQTVPLKARRSSKVLDYKESDCESSECSENMEFFDSEDEDPIKRTCGVTKKIKKIPHRKKKYKIIPDNLRETLIEAVQVRGEKIKQAAKKLRINYSSAKSICQIFKKEGRSSKKTFKKRANGEDENSPTDPESTNSVSKERGMVKTESLSDTEMKQEHIHTPQQMEKKPVNEKDDGLVLKDQILNKLSYFESRKFPSLEPTVVPSTSMSIEELHQPQQKLKKNPSHANHENISLSLGKASSFSPEDPQEKNLLSRLERKSSPEHSLPQMKPDLIQQKLLSSRLQNHHQHSHPLLSSPLLSLNNLNLPPSQLQANLLSLNNQGYHQNMLWNLNPQELLLMENYSTLVQQNLNLMYKNPRQNQHSMVPPTQYPYNHLYNNSYTVNHGYLNQMSSLQSLGKLISQFPEKQNEILKSQLQYK